MKKLSKKIIEILEANQFSVNQYWNDGKYYADLNCRTPEGEDWWESIEYDGTNKDFIAAVRDRHDNFDVDEETCVWIESRGRNGVPDSIKALVIDQEWKEDKLGTLADSLEKFDVTLLLIEEVEELNNNTPNGIIVDADIILADVLEESDFEFYGFSQDIFNIWKNSSDKKAVEKMFYEFTDMEFETYLEECIKKISRKQQQINEKE